MQIRSVLFIVGVLLVCVGASLVLPLGVSLWYGDGAFLGLLSSLVIMVGGGLALAYTNRSQTPLNLTLRDGFAVVGICWIVASFAGGLPFVLTSTASVTDAVLRPRRASRPRARRFLQISRACRTACSCGAA